MRTLYFWPKETQYVSSLLKLKTQPQPQCNITSGWANIWINDFRTIFIWFPVEHEYLYSMKYCCPMWCRYTNSRISRAYHSCPYHDMYVQYSCLYVRIQVWSTCSFMNVFQIIVSTKVKLLNWCILYQWK